MGSVKQLSSKQATIEEPENKPATTFLKKNKARSKTKPKVDDSISNPIMTNQQILDMLITPGIQQRKQTKRIVDIVARSDKDIYLSEDGPLRFSRLPQAEDQIQVAVKKGLKTGANWEI